MARIGDYRLGKAIGVGTVGTVYRARSRRSGTDVALKILLPQVSEDRNILRRFEREMSILEKLDHPNIVRYLGDGNDKGRLYYAMELVDCGTLKDELELRGRLPWRKVCRYGQQICSALQHAHNHGIIHRDLKPGNLFLSGNGQLKLGDFGIARDTGSVDLTDSGMTVGTYAFMAPEQIRGGSQVSDKTDLYSLGCLLYLMLTGQLPFQGENFAQIFDQHLQSPPPRPSQLTADCPEELDRLVEQLMAKHPDQRPFNARYVQGYLRSLLDKYGTGPGDPCDNGPLASAGAPANVTATREIRWSTMIGILLLLVGVIGVVVIANNVGP
jgi:serine/threonine protein kinase